MDRFYHYVIVIFVIACNVVHGLYIDLNEYHFESMQDVLTYPQGSYYIDYVDADDLYSLRRKRGFFSSFKMPSVVPFITRVDENNEKTAAGNTIITSDADVTTTVNSKMTAAAENVEAAYRSFIDFTQSSKETHIVCIGPDVKKSLVEAGPYLPLVNKLTTYIIPELSLSDVVTFSLNVATLTTQGIKDNENAEVTGAQTKPDAGDTISQYATGVYDKLKHAFKSHIGHVTNYFSDEEKTNSLEKTHSIFDKVKSKMNIFGNYMNSIDSPQTENKENQIETIVTQTYIEDSQPPITDTIVTNTYGSGEKLIQKLTNGETNKVILNNQLLENGNRKIGKLITEMKNGFDSNENSENDSNIEAYDDDNDDGTNDDDDGTMDDDDGTMDDDDETMDDDDGSMNDNIEIKEEDFNKVMQESMVLQPDFINTLDGEELLNRIDQLQKSLANPNPNNRKAFEAVIEELDIDEHYSEDRVNELIDVLEKSTNYFIVRSIEKNELLTTPPTSPTLHMD